MCPVNDKQFFLLPKLFYDPPTDFSQWTVQIEAHAAKENEAGCWEIIFNDMVSYKQHTFKWDRIQYMELIIIHIQFQVISQQYHLNCFCFTIFKFGKSVSAQSLLYVIWIKREKK